MNFLTLDLPSSYTSFSEIHIKRVEDCSVRLPVVTLFETPEGVGKVNALVLRRHGPVIESLSMCRVASNQQIDGADESNKDKVVKIRV